MEHAKADAVSRDGYGRGAEGEELTGHLEGPGGATPAVWATVALIIVATAVGGFGLVLGSALLFWVGAALFVLGGVGSLGAGIMRATH